MYFCPPSLLALSDLFLYFEYADATSWEWIRWQEKSVAQVWHTKYGVYRRKEKADVRDDPMQVQQWRFSLYSWLQVQLKSYGQVPLAPAALLANTGQHSVAWVVFALGSDAIFGNLEEGLFGKFYVNGENGWEQRVWARRFPFSPRHLRASLLWCVLVGGGWVGCCLFLLCWMPPRFFAWHSPWANRASSFSRPQMFRWPSEPWSAHGMSSKKNCRAVVSSTFESTMTLGHYI